MATNNSGPPAGDTEVCAACEVDFDPDERRYRLVDRRGRANANRQADPYCATCVGLLFQTAFDAGAFPAFGHLQIDDYAEVFADRPAFIERYKRRENYSSMYPHWARISCSACNDYVGQYRRPLGNRRHQETCPNVDCRQPVCMTCGTASPDQGHVCEERHSRTNDEYDEHGNIPSREYQICPNCHLDVQHAGACNAMLSRCNTSFCYICGLEADEGTMHWSQIRGVCPKYNHPTPRNRDDTDGHFSMPSWLWPWHPHLGPSISMWRDPNRPPVAGVPARNLDGDFPPTRRRHSPGQWRDPPEDRPILHECVGTDQFEELTEGGSDWRHLAELLDRQLHAFGQDSIARVWMEEKHVAFVRQMLLCGRNMYRMRHNGLDLGDGRAISRRLLFVHLVANFRQYLLYLNHFPPNDMDLQEFETFSKRRVPNFYTCLRDLDKVWMPVSKQPTEDAIATIQTFLRHILITYDVPVPILEGPQPTIGDAATRSMIELAKRLTNILRLVPRPRNGHVQSVARGHVQPVDSVPLACDYWQIDEILRDRRLRPQTNDQQKVSQLARTVVDESLDWEWGPQWYQGSRVDAASVGDLEWSRDITLTLDPLLDSVGDQDQDVQQSIRATFGIISRLHQILSSFETNVPLMNRVQDLHTAIETARPTVTLHVLGQILDHAGQITGGLLGHLNGIFAGLEDEGRPPSEWTFHLRWATYYSWLMEQAEASRDLDEDDLRVKQHLLDLLPWLDYLRRPDLGDFGWMRDDFEALRHTLMPRALGYRAPEETGLLNLTSRVVAAVMAFNPPLFPYGVLQQLDVDFRYLESLDFDNDIVLRDHAPSLQYLMRRLLNDRADPPNANRRNDHHHLNRIRTLYRKLFDDQFVPSAIYHQYAERTPAARDVYVTVCRVLGAAAHSEAINPVFGSFEPRYAFEIRDDMRQVENIEGDTEDPCEYLEGLRWRLSRLDLEGTPRGPWRHVKSTWNLELDRLLEELQVYISLRRTPQDERPENADQQMNEAILIIQRHPWPWVFPLGNVRQLLPRLMHIRGAVLAAADRDRPQRSGTQLILDLHHGNGHERQDEQQQDERQQDERQQDERQQDERQQDEQQQGEQQ